MSGPKSCSRYSPAQIIIHIVAGDEVIDLEGQERDVLAVPEPVKGTVDLVEFMGRQVGFLIQDQLKHPAVPDARNNGPGILLITVPGHIPAGDARALQCGAHFPDRLPRALRTVADKDFLLLHLL